MTNKNLERAAAALHGVRCKLYIIGEISPSQKNALETNQVAYTTRAGLSDEAIREAYRNCDLLLFPSTYEGFGLPIIEAQATGRPVVTGNICSMPEIAGGGACLVDPFDVASIRDGVMRITQNPRYRERLVETGFLNIARFSPDNIARQYADIYQEICRERIGARDEKRAHEVAEEVHH
jgi:glycosyltransferase involved in cell wall biosynthesis